MAYYTVPIVKKELLSLWHEFWDKGDESSPEALKAMDRGDLGRTVEIKAKNAREAGVEAGRKNPDYFVIYKSISRRS